MPESSQAQPSADKGAQGTQAGQGAQGAGGTQSASPPSKASANGGPQSKTTQSKTAQAASTQATSPKNSQAKSRGVAGSAAGAASSRTKAGPGGAAEGPIEMIKADHRKVEALFDQFQKADDRQKGALCRQICAELIIHTMIEEEIFYPECRRRAGQDEQAEEKLDEAQVEHDSAKVLVADLYSGGDRDPLRDAKVQVLAEQIRHHVREEEEPGDGVLAKALALGLDTPDLARRLQQRKQQLQQQAQDGRLRPPPPVSISNPARSQGRSYQEENMPRERDERGRFMSDDDRDYGRSYAERGGGRSRYEDDDRRGQGGWFGDPEGHSRASREGWEERRDDYRPRGRDDDDYRGGRYAGDRGQGGWFGDPEGHSRAAREAWDEHRDSYMRSREERGWFGDPEGHSRASREGWGERSGEDRSYRSGDRGQGGWFGDPEGHSRASREGWDERRGDYRSRGRDDDDDRGRSGRRGQGGWFGDPEGHSRASRRGWDDRR